MLTKSFLPLRLCKFITLPFTSCKENDGTVTAAEAKLLSTLFCCCEGVLCSVLLLEQDATSTISAMPVTSTFFISGSLRLQIAVLFVLARVNALAF
jgi:hypothetical protein